MRILSSREDSPSRILETEWRGKRRVRHSRHLAFVTSSLIKVETNWSTKKLPKTKSVKFASFLIITVCKYLNFQMQKNFYEHIYHYARETFFDCQREFGFPITWMREFEENLPQKCQNILLIDANISIGCLYE